MAIAVILFTESICQPVSTATFCKVVISISPRVTQLASPAKTSTQSTGRK